MRSALRGLIVAGLLAGAPSPSLARDEGSQRVPTAAELRQCPHLARVDWQRVSRDLAEWTRTRPATTYDVNAEHRRIRGPWPMPDLSRAEIAIDIAIGPGETQDTPTSTSSFVWREPGGPWQVDRVDHVSASPPPPPPGSHGMTQEELERAVRPVTRGPLSRSQAEEIDRVLADPCFAIQPDVTPFQLPLTTGQIDSCSGAISRTIRLRRGAETREVTDLCGRWPSHALANAVMYASIGLGTLVEQTARARFPGADIRLLSLRVGQRRSITPLYCGEMVKDGETVPILFESWQSGGLPQNDLVLPGGDYRWGGTFEEVWQSRCTQAEQPASAPSHH